MNEIITIDLNCDLGEGMAADDQIMPFISSANISCGFHAGDDETMESTVAMCLKHHVAIGVHPGFDDKGNFGRRDIQLSSAQEYYRLVFRQIEILQTVASKMNAKLHHVKPHGALYNMSAKDPQIAAAIATAVKDFDPSLRLFGLAGSCSISEAEKAGLHAVHEFFADRTYQDDGSLTPRSHPDALITEDSKAWQQALQIAEQRMVVSVSGKTLHFSSASENQDATICLHGDGPHALSFARLIHDQLLAHGIQIKVVP